MKLQIAAGIEAAPVALGCMRMTSLSENEAEKVIGTALDAGYTLFDHADIYGGGASETIFGRVLKKNPGWREQMIIQDKCGICRGYYDASSEHIIEAAEGSLKRLGVEQLDLLLLHRPDALMEPEEVAGAFYALHKAGKVRAFGVSNMNAAQISLLQSGMALKLSVNQMQFGLAHSGLVDEGIHVNTMNGQAIDRTGSLLDYCRLNKITIQAWSPLQYGMFEGPFLTSEKYAGLNELIAQMAEQYGVSAEAIALAWILRHSAGMQAIIGSMNPDRIRSAGRAAEIRLTRKEWYDLYLAAGNPLP